MMKLAGLVVVLLLLGIGSTARADDWGPATTGGQATPEPRDPLTSVMPPAEFLEKNYINYNLPAIGPKGDRGNVPLFFEAQVAPHLFLYNGLYKTKRFVRADHWWERIFFSTSLTPLFRLRMVFSDPAYHNTSSPVRPVSFMPRLDLQWFYFDRLRQPKPPQPTGDDAARAGQDSLVLLVAPRVAIGHHSNGQEHCSFDKTEVLLDVQDPCPAWNGPNEVNFRSGDFSTNYLIGGINTSLLWLEQDTSYEYKRINAGVIFEANPKDFLGESGLNDQEYPLYGPYRLQLDLGGDWFQRTQGNLGPGSGLWSVNLAYMKIFGADSAIASYRFTAEISRTFFKLDGVGFFARFFSGQDYLNILFTQKVPWTIQLGLVFDLTPRLQYRLQPGV